MKTCICCGTKANADVCTCANCGEGSWTMGESKPTNPTNSAIENDESKIATSNGPIETDPDTSPQIPTRKRGKKPS